MSHFNCLESHLHVGPLEESGLSELLTNEYANRKKMILVDENTNEACLPQLFMFIDGLSEAEILELPAGEDHKTLDMCFPVWETLSEMEFGRNDLLICLGGGMICDMGGLIASLYKRGMDCIYIPTSLLAMADASIGGKTAVDLGSFKNQLGVFSSPKHVFVDTVFLQTLAEKEMLNGWAEMLKHGLIADSIHFENLRFNGVENLNEDLLLQSLKIKARIVELDPTEKGERKLLNFGHTVGHAIEGHFLHSNNSMDHGLAVAHGMMIESKISNLLNLLSDEHWNKIEAYLNHVFEFRSFSNDELYAIKKLMQQDKKRVGDKSSFSLLKEIGTGVFDVDVPNEILTEAFQVLMTTL